MSSFFSNLNLISKFILILSHARDLYKSILAAQDADRSSVLCDICSRALAGSPSQVQCCTHPQTERKRVGHTVGFQMKNTLVRRSARSAPGQFTHGCIAPTSCRHGLTQPSTILYLAEAARKVRYFPIEYEKAPANAELCDTCSRAVRRRLCFRHWRRSPAHLAKYNVVLG